jgi:excisionase family DNA binding protein
MAQKKQGRQEKEESVISVGDLLTVSEVARRLRVDDTTVRRWIKAGALEAVLLPHTGKRCGYRIKKTTLDTLVNEGSLPA